MCGFNRTWLLTTLQSSFDSFPPSKSKHCWRPRSPRRWRSAVGSWCETSGGAAGPPTTTPATAAGRGATCCAATTVLQPSTSSAGQSHSRCTHGAIGAACSLSPPWVELAPPEADVNAAPPGCSGSPSFPHPCPSLRPEPPCCFLCWLSLRACMNESRLQPLLLKMESRLSVFTIWRPRCSLSAPAAPSCRLPAPPSALLR